MMAISTDFLFVNVVAHVCSAFIGSSSQMLLNSIAARPLTDFEAGALCLTFR
jgi:hypothetical protein